MKQIRHGIFETNSSSSHSISISRRLNGYYTSEEIVRNWGYPCDDPDWDGKLSFYSSELEFEREPFEPLVFFRDKIRYAIASLGHNDDYRKQIEDVMYEMIPNLKVIEYPLEHSWKTKEWEVYYGMVDHQSYGLLHNFLLDKNITIREFLLNKKYVIFIDGDEYQIKEKLFETCLMHEDDFEDSYGIEKL